jgi:hypothetical protein
MDERGLHEQPSIPLRMSPRFTPGLTQKPGENPTRPRWPTRPVSPSSMAPPSPMHLARKGHVRRANGWDFYPRSCLAASIPRPRLQQKEAKMANRPAKLQRRYPTGTQPWLPAVPKCVPGGVPDSCSLEPGPADNLPSTLRPMFCARVPFPASRTPPSGARSQAPARYTNRGSQDRGGYGGLDGVVPGVPGRLHLCHQGSRVSRD